MLGTPWHIWPFRMAVFATSAAILALGILGVRCLLALSGGKDSRRFAAGLIIGADGRPSTSKFQAIVWTGLALFAVIEVFLERFWIGEPTLDVSIPANLLLAMGFSATTLTAAKGITVAYVNSGLVKKDGDRATDPPRLSSLVTDDNGFPDLSKVQMLAFTAVAVVTYLLRMATQTATPPVLVDIEPALMVLMGLSHGAYLGKKLTSTETPRITSVSPSKGDAGVLVRVTGTAFGATQGGSVITLGGTPVQAMSWSEREITVRVPEERAPGVPWIRSERVELSVIVNGRTVESPMGFFYVTP